MTPEPGDAGEDDGRATRRNGADGGSDRHDDGAGGGSDRHDDGAGGGREPAGGGRDAGGRARDRPGGARERAGARETARDSGAGGPERGGTPAPPPDTGEGDALIRGDAVGTALFTVTAAAAAALPDTFVPAFVPVALALFAVGCVAFVWSYFRALGRSRFEVVSLAGAFFLADNAAPARVRRALWALLAAQVVVAVAAAAARPFTPLAFGTLSPTFGLGLMALWGARHAAFPPRPADDRRAGRPPSRAARPPDGS